MDAAELKAALLSRRSALHGGGAAALLLSQAAVFERLGRMPRRPSPAGAGFPDVQFDLGAFISPPQLFNDGAGSVTAQFPPVYTVFLPAMLTRTPTVADQAVLADALATVEDSFPASPAGVLIYAVGYGLPYFRRLPRALVRSHLPTLRSDPRRPVLEEAVPAPTDVVHGLVGGWHAVNPGSPKTASTSTWPSKRTTCCSSCAVIR